MDQLFTVGNMASQAILDATCGHLSIEDLLKLEKVTPLTGMAVAAHHYQQLVTLGKGTPKLTARLTDPDSGERRAGPVITRAAIEMTFGVQAFQNVVVINSSAVRQQWHWTVATIAARAEHLSELHLKLDSFLDNKKSCNVEFHMTKSHLREMNLHANHLLSGVTFSRCTSLKADFRIMAQNHRLIVMPDLLKHFPALEDLVLRGERLPRISSLPAPNRLKKLNLSLDDHENQLLADQLIICNFSGLESFSFMNETAIDERIVETETLNTICGLTGVDWMASFDRHPPTGLEHIALPCLAEWSLFLLDRCIALSAASCRSLALDNLATDDDVDLSLLGTGPVGRFLCNLTHLKTLNSDQTNESVISQFLALTPSLTSLALNIFQNVYLGQKPFDANLPLRHLTKLVLVAPLPKKKTVYSSMVTPDWIKTVRRNASPAGLKIGINFMDYQSGKIEEEEVPNQ